MSIQDLLNRIKARLPRRAGEEGNVEIVEFSPEGSVARHTLLDTFFLSVIILLVAIGSFGLGRLSGAGKRPGVEIHYENMEATSRPLQDQSANTLKAASSSGLEVIVSKNGSKYHYLYCAGAKQIKEENRISFPSAEAAEAAGYILAGNCQKK